MAVEVGGDDNDPKSGILAYWSSNSGDIHRNTKKPHKVHVWAREPPCTWGLKVCRYIRLVSKRYPNSLNGSPENCTLYDDV